MTPIFLDASYLIALEAADDQKHVKAQQHWRSFRETQSLLITTSYVFDEIVTFFNSRSRHAKAVEIGTRLLHGQAMELIHVDQDLFLTGWEYLQQHTDKLYSLTDCISFVLMRQRSIYQALAFDQHFTQAGFQRLPA